MIIYTNDDQITIRGELWDKDWDLSQKVDGSMGRTDERRRCRRRRRREREWACGDWNET